MSEPNNPFASPQAIRRPTDNVVASVNESRGCWREGDLLVLLSYGAELPPRCVKCSAPAHSQVKLKLTWAQPALYLLLVFLTLPALILILIMQKKATVYAPLCEAHLARRKNTRLIAGGIMLLFPILFLGGIFLFALDRNAGMDFGGFAMVAGVACLFIGAILWSVVSPSLNPKRINKRFAWLKGANEELLAELPDFPGEH